MKPDFTNVFSTSTQVTGQVFASDYAVPTPSGLTTAIGDMEIAYTDAAGRLPTEIPELGAGNIGGKTLKPGVYKWSTDLLITSDIILTGSATDVWIFQVALNLKMSSAKTIVLIGGALPKNVFWRLLAGRRFRRHRHRRRFVGVLLTKTHVNLQTGAWVNGRLLAQTAVTIASSTVVEPAP